MIYCLDTNIVIALLRYETRVVEKLRALPVNRIMVPDIVRAELLLGCCKCARPEQERAKVDHVLDPLTRVPFADEAPEHYAQIRAELEESGNVIGPNDLLIAATVRSMRSVGTATLVTRNVKEFSRVPGLLVEDWN